MYLSTCPPVCASVYVCVFVRICWFVSVRDCIYVYMSIQVDTLPYIFPDTILVNKHKVRSGQELVRTVRAGAVRCVCERVFQWGQRNLSLG